MKILITEFRQESNSLSPELSDLEQWRSGWLLEAGDVYATLKSVECAVGGMIEVLEAASPRPEIVFGPAFCSQSGGTAEQSVMDAYWARLAAAIKTNGPLDAVYFSFHGALQTTEFDDAEGEIVRRVRALAGPDCVLAASMDMHGYVPKTFAAEIDLICGYHTYPHVDFAETGRRTARLGLMALTGPARPVMAWAPVPMIVSASAYNTMGGPFKELTDYAQSLLERGDLLDFSFFQMQPWLDIPAPNSAIITIARDAEGAESHARHLAERLYGLRHAFSPRLAAIDQAIDRAEDPASAKPVILVDSADSPNAGAPGDSMAVAQRLLDRRSTLRAATVVRDPATVARAFAIGIGGTAEFTVGSCADRTAVHITAKGYVRSLHDGEFRQEYVGHGGKISRLGRTAVIRFGTLDVLVCERIVAPGDPQLYRGFGIEPKLYDLVVVKANTSFRVGYSKFAGEIIEVDTPGAAGPNILTLPFKKLPRTIFPWSDEPVGSLKAVLVGFHGRAAHR